MLQRPRAHAFDPTACLGTLIAVELLMFGFSLRKLAHAAG
jgi:hypothetical protein